jgi:hypothetical protein
VIDSRDSIIDGDYDAKYGDNDGEGKDGCSTHKKLLLFSAIISNGCYIHIVTPLTWFSQKGPVLRLRRSLSDEVCVWSGQTSSLNERRRRKLRHLMSAAGANFTTQ